MQKVMKKSIVSIIITLIMFIIFGACSSCSTLFPSVETILRNDSIIILY